MACKWYHVCPLRIFERQKKIGSRWADEYCRSDRNWENCRRYQLEEEGNFHPDNMLPDGTIDEKLD
jgi:hypothetical protein